MSGDTKTREDRLGPIDPIEVSTWAEDKDNVARAIKVICYVALAAYVGLYVYKIATTGDWSLL